VKTLPFASTILFALAPIMLAQGQTASPMIGTVGIQDATVSGELSITSGRAVLVGSSSVIAKDHTAEVQLHRGGVIRVCATSGLHLTQSTAAGVPALMMALDRGAIEVQTAVLASDVIMTPDLRFAMRGPGPLDLQLRVTNNGDTCVENKGASAPTIGITDQFGEASYQLRPGQHVLFEHGSLKEVVDHETSPCGCPAPTPEGPIADEHPFPAAISTGLAPPPPVPQAPPGVAHAQVSTSLGYSGDGAGTISGTPVPPPAPPTPATPAPQKGFGHSIGHFFKRLFGRG